MFAAGLRCADGVKQRDAGFARLDKLGLISMLGLGDLVVTRRVLRSCDEVVMKCSFVTSKSTRAGARGDEQFMQEGPPAKVMARLSYGEHFRCI